MKNSCITFSQFLLSCFLSTFSALLFINNEVGLTQLVFVIIATVLNYIIISLCKFSLSGFWRLSYYVYFLLISFSVLNRIVLFLHYDITSSPFWVLLLIMFTTVLICSQKGIEAIARASGIICFFALIFVLYIIFAISYNMDFTQKTFVSYKLMPSLLLLFPSVFYNANINNIKNNNRNVKVSYSKYEKKLNDKEKQTEYNNEIMNNNSPKINKTHLLIYSIVTMVIMIFSIFISASVDKKFPLYFIGKKAHIGVFKGVEFLLLVLITIGVVYLLLLSLISLSKGNNKKSGVFLGLITISCGFSLYLEFVKWGRYTEYLELIITTITILLIIIMNFFSKKRISKI